MRKIIAFGLLAATLALAAPSQAQQQGALYCSQNVQYDGTANGSTRIFTAAAASSNRVYICGYTIQVGATATNIQLRSGTGTNCGTGTANVTPLFVLPIAGRLTDHSSTWRGLVSPGGNDLCIFTSAGNPVQAIIYYTYQQ